MHYDVLLYCTVQNWVRSACIGGHGNSCRYTHSNINNVLLCSELCIMMYYCTVLYRTGCVVLVSEVTAIPAGTLIQGSIFLLKVEFFPPPLKLCVNFLPRRGKFLAPQARFFSVVPRKVAIYATHFTSFTILKVILHRLP